MNRSKSKAYFAKEAPHDRREILVRNLEFQEVSFFNYNLGFPKTMDRSKEAPFVLFKDRDTKRGSNLMDMLIL